MSAYGFDVLSGGGADALDAITGYSDGDIALGIISGRLLAYQLDADSGLSADDDLVIAPDDVGGGDARWIKMMPGGPMSSVEVTTNTEQTLTSGDDIIFEIENEDTLSEYNTSTGVFTAKYAGVYHVSCSVLTKSVTWSSNTTCRIGLNKNSAAYWSGNFIRIQNSFTGTLNPLMTTTVELAANDTINCFFVHDTSGSGVAANTAFNRFTIRRLV